MWSVEPTPRSELAAIAVDSFHATSQHAYTVKSGSEVIAYIGVNTLSLVATVGWPWVKLVHKNLLTSRQVVKIARRALQLWAEEYRELRVSAEEGVNKKWFEALGFTLDTQVKPVYVDGRRMVQYRYGRNARPD